MKVPSTPTLLMASLALSSSTLAVPVDKHAAQSPNPAGGMSPRSPRLNDGLLAFPGRSFDYGSVNMINIPEQLARRNPETAADSSLISSTSDLLNSVGALASDLEPAISTVEGIVNALPGGEAVDSILKGLGLKLAETQKNAEQVSSLINQNQKRAEDSQDGSQGLIPGIQAPTNTPNPQLLNPNIISPYLGQVAPPNTPLTGLSGITNLIPGIIPGSIAGLSPFGSISSLTNGINVGQLPSALGSFLPNVAAVEALENNHLLAEVAPSSTAATVSTSVAESFPTDSASFSVPSSAAESSA